MTEHDVLKENEVKAAELLKRIDELEKSNTEMCKLLQAALKRIDDIDVYTGRPFDSNGIFMNNISKIEPISRKKWNHTDILSIVQGSLSARVSVVERR